MMRALPATFDPDVVAAIDARLDAIVAGGIAIPLAIESGSRAWGFPSPDSDYDCRFLYIRPCRDYLALWPQRDVIETPLDAVLDVNGWDLAKALRLVVKGNAVVIEWLRSPIVYRGDPAFRAQLEAFAVAHAPRDAIRRHYLHLGLRQWDRHGAGEIAGKKLFYALRPAAALRWMRLHPDGMPPMHFPTLMAQSALPDAVGDLVDALVARKALGREAGRMEIPPPLAAFVTHELDAAGTVETDTGAPPPPKETLAAANAVFRDMLDRYAPA